MSHDPHTLQNLFIGLMPDKRVQAALQRHRATWNWPQAAWLPRAERLHLTVCSLQGVPAIVVPQLRKLMHDVPMQPFDLVLRTPAIFDNRGCQGVITADRNEGLLTLRARLDQVLEQLRYQSPPLGCPHVTLAWHAQGATPPQGTRPIAWHVNGFALVWSKMGHESREGEYVPAHHDVLEVCGASPGKLPPLPVQASLFA